MVAKQTKVEATKQVQFSTNLCTVIGMKKHVTKLLKAHEIDANLSNRASMTALGMHRDPKLKKKLKSSCDSKNQSNLVQTISSISHYSY